MSRKEEDYEHLEHINTQLLEALEAFRLWMLSGHNINEVNGLMDQAQTAIEAAKS